MRLGLNVSNASVADGYGIVLLVEYVGEPFAGKKSVYVLSSSKLQTGDKLATWHGQKYIAKVQSAVSLKQRAIVQVLIHSLRPLRGTIQTLLKNAQRGNPSHVIAWQEH
jgi:hypothetical protein